MSKRAILYCRVSTIEQADNGVSLAAQEAKLRAYCTLKEITIVEVLVEQGVSGTKPLRDRPEGSRLLDLLAAGEADQVIALRLDRLFRCSIMALETARQWDRQGVTLRLIDEGGDAVDNRSAVGRLYFTMNASQAQFVRDLISERTAQALQFKKSRRAAYTRSVYGFENCEGKMVEIPEEMAEVDRMRELRSEGASLRSIASDLNSRGIATKRRGSRWYAASVKSVIDTHATL